MKVALHVGQITQPIPGGIGRYTRSLIESLPRDEVTLYTFACAESPQDAPPRYKRVSRLNYRLEPLVVTAHDIAFMRHPGAFSKRGVRFHTKGLKIARNEACALIVPSRFTHDELVREGVNPNLIHVIPHGIKIHQDIDSSHDEELPKRFVLAVGTIEPRKNLPMLVRAVEEARETGEDISLVLVGPRGWGDVNGLDRDFVYELGRIEDDILNALMRQAIVYCVPSIYEGFGMPALEAMASRTPVIASGVASLPEVVGDAGTLLDPLDSQSWAEAIVKISQDVDFRNDQAERGYVRAKSFTWESSARAHVAAYREALRIWRNKR